MDHFLRPEFSGAPLCSSYARVILGRSDRFQIRSLIHAIHHVSGCEAKDVARLEEAMKGRDFSLLQGIPGGQERRRAEQQGGQTCKLKELLTTAFLFFRYLVVHGIVQKGAGCPDGVLLVQQLLKAKVLISLRQVFSESMTKIGHIFSPH